LSVSSAELAGEGSRPYRLRRTKPQSAGRVAAPLRAAGVPTRLCPAAGSGCRQKVAIHAPTASRVGLASVVECPECAALDAAV